MSTGLMGVIPALPLYIEERFGIDDPPTVARWTAVVYGIAPLTAALFGPLWGALGDRIGRKAMVVRAQLAVGVAMLLMPLAPDPFWLAVLRMLQGMFAGYIAPAMALVSADAPVERQGRIIARLQLALALGLATGPAVAAEVAAQFGRAAVFQGAGVLALASSLPVLLFAVEGRGRRVKKTPLAGGEAAAPWLVRHGALLWVLLVILVLRFGLMMVEPFTALLVRELGALPWLTPADDPSIGVDRTTAVAFTILAVGQLLFTSLWGRLSDLLGPARCLALVTAVLAVILGLTSRVESVEEYLILRCVAAVFMAGTMTLAYAAVGRRVGPEHRALAFAFAQSCMQLGMSLGPMLGSGLVDDLGLRGLFVVSSGLLGVAAVGMIAAWVVRARAPARRDDAQPRQ